MKLEHPYDLRRTPPAPVLLLRVGVPRRGPAVGVAALVDSGADLSVLPQAVARQLGLPVIGEVTVRSVGGSPRRVHLYAAQVEVAGAARIVEVVGLGQETLVGRDLLNGWVVTLDGPGRRVRVEV